MGNERKPGAAGHVAPYLTWVSFILVFHLAASLGFKSVERWLPHAYALKTAVCFALLAWLKPWRLYGGCGDCWRRDTAIGALWGLLVAFVWILPETPFIHEHLRPVSLFYNKWLVAPLGDWPDYFDPISRVVRMRVFEGMLYSPSEAGWPLAAARLVGSAFAIPVAEEFFFRGFLYRWMRNADWREVPLSRFDRQSFLIVCLLFALEHDRWLAGLFAGAVFGMLAVRRGGLRAAISAHVAANLVIGIYVLSSGDFRFW